MTNHGYTPDMPAYIQTIPPEVRGMRPEKLSFLDFAWDRKVQLAAGFYGVFLVGYTLFSAFGMLPTSLQAQPEKVAEANATAALLSLTEREAQNAAPVSAAALVSTATATATAPAVEAPVQPVKIKTKASAAATPTAKVNHALDPIRVVIEKIGTDVKVSNPASAKDTVLDEYLKKGAVRYPGSAGLGEGNVFIFAHSTNHQVVVNQAYKAFNNFNALVAGDVIKVYSLDKEYTYVVDRVRLADADEIYVDFSVGRNMITLSTCNTFGEKQERYVVEASFAGSKALTEQPI